MSKPPTSRGPSRPARPSAARMWLVGAAVAAVVVVGTLLASRGGDGGDGRIDHVHGLAVNPADGTLYVAAHNGLFALASGAASRVGDGAQDTMGFTAVGPDHFLASGHPAPVAGGPDHLGLIESRDAGVSWQTRSLSGEADFHALRHRHDTTYGYNAVTGQFMVSADGVEWESWSAPDLFDLAVSPEAPQLVLGTTRAGVVRSSDGGRTWGPAGDPPAVLLAWETADRLWGITATGEVLRASDGGAEWSAAGDAPGAPTAFAAHRGDLYVADRDGGIFHSGDAAASWDRLHP